MVPDIMQNIEKARSDIEAVCSKVEMLEALLTEQTELLANSSLAAWRNHQSVLTQQHAQQKQLELQEYEQHLRVSTFKITQQKLEIEKLKIHEKITEQMLRAKEKEREDRIKEQQVFLEQQKLRESVVQAFQQDMEFYKTHGISRGQKKRRRKKRQPTLEQVQLETETAELEEFLGETNSDGEGSPLQEQSNDEHSSERPVVLTEEVSQFI